MTQDEQARVRKAGWQMAVEFDANDCAGPTVRYWISPHQFGRDRRETILLYTSEQALAQCPTPESRLRDALRVVQAWREGASDLGTMLFTKGVPTRVDAEKALDSVRDLL